MGAAANSVGCLDADRDLPGADAAPASWWSPVTVPGAGKIERGQFRLEAGGRVVAIVDNRIAAWSGDEWTPLTSAPRDLTIEQFTIDESRIHAFLMEARGGHIAEHVDGLWEPRTVRGPTYTGAFAAGGPGDGIYATVTNPDRTNRIWLCDLNTCLPATSPGLFSPVDFDCTGCDEGDPTFFAQLGTKVCRADDPVRAWTPQTTDGDLGPRIIATPVLTVEISDQLHTYDGSAFVPHGPPLPGLTDFARGETGDLFALADGVVWQLQAP